MAADEWTKNVVTIEKIVASAVTAESIERAWQEWWDNFRRGLA